MVGQDAIFRDEDDALRHREVADAVAQFVLDDRTDLPLTISVEGEWGTGKSSFMSLLRRRLGEAEGDKQFVTVWFNPWRYETVEAMWAAFAISLTEQLGRSLGPLEKLGAWIRLLFRRFSFRRNWHRLLRPAFSVLGWTTLVAVAILVIGILIEIGEKDAHNILGAAKSVVKSAGSPYLWLSPIVAFIITAIGSAGRFLGSPVTSDLLAYFRTPNYAEKATVLQSFHSDFRHILLTHSGKTRRIAVFIDDLDRCEIPIAAEVLRSLNLFFATEQDESQQQSEKIQMVTFLGMDREKVAACVAAQHEKILPWLDDGRSGGEDRPTREDALRFGYRYLEKFVHVVLTLPRPGPTEIEELIDRICTPEEPRRGTVNTKSPKDKGSTPISPDTLAEAEEAETHLVREVATLAAKALGNNPRRIKQFVNLYRLRIQLAVQLRVFASTPEKPKNKDQLVLTLEQIGKLVAIEVASPILFQILKRDDKFLNPHSPTAKSDLNHLIRRRSVYEMIRSRPGHVSEEDAWKWDLHIADIRRYARIGLPTSDFERAEIEENLVEEDSQV